MPISFNWCFLVHMYILKYPTYLGITSSYVQPNWTVHAISPIFTNVLCLVHPNYQVISHIFAHFQSNWSVDTYTLGVVHLGASALFLKLFIPLGIFQWNYVTPGWFLYQNP